MVGPVERPALKAAKALGYLDNDSPVVPEGSEIWARYGDLPGEPPSPPRHVTPYHSWVNDFFVTRCPSCRSQVRVEGRHLSGKRIPACPTCGSKLRLDRLPLEPENPAPYRLSYPARFFSYEGRAGIGDFWLLFGMPAAIPFLFGIYTGDEGLVPPIVSIAVRLVVLAWLIPVGLPAFVRRLHDRNQSGAWAWVLLIIIIPTPTGGSFVSDDPLLVPVGISQILLAAAKILLIPSILVMLGLFRGEKKFNRYGPPPSNIRYE